MEMWLQPSLTGVYAIGGLYISRNLTGTNTPVNWQMLAVLAGTSIASSALAPRVLPYLVCPESSSADLVEAGVSAGLSWGALALMSQRPADAGMFIPIQVGSHYLATYMRPYVANWLEKKPGDPGYEEYKEKEKDWKVTDQKYRSKVRRAEPADRDEYNPSPYGGVSSMDVNGGWGNIPMF